jgi:hypothetical protein
MLLPGATTSGFIRFSSGPQFGPAGPRLEKLLIVNGGSGSVEPTLNAVVERRRPVRRRAQRHAAGPSLPADQVRTTPAASQASIASHQRLSHWK